MCVCVYVCVCVCVCVLLLLSVVVVVVVVVMASCDHHSEPPADRISRCQHRHGLLSTEVLAPFQMITFEEQAGMFTIPALPRSRLYQQPACELLEVCNCSPG